MTDREGSAAARANGARPAAVVFDLDGTLIDSKKDIVHSVAMALAEHGVTAPTDDVIASYVGDGARLLIARALGAAKDDARVPPVLASYLSFYEAHPVERTVFMPGAMAALDALAGVPLALCTSKPRGVTDAVLAALGLADRFKVIVAGGDVPRIKPDPLPLVHVAERLGLPVAVLAMVGDGVQDVECGRAAGAFTVAVTGGFTATETLLAARPNLVLANLFELPRALFPRGFGRPPSPQGNP